MAAPAFVANGSGVTITTVDAAVGFPSHQINDLAILRVKSPNEAVTLSVPSGFIRLGTEQGTGTPGAAGSAMLTIFFRFCESTGETPPTVAALASTRQQFAAISTYRGAYIGNPPLVGSRGVGTGTAVTMTGGTTTTANTRVLMTIADGIDANGARASAQANADLVGIAENFDNGSSTDIGGGWSSASGTKAVAGAYGTSTATLTTSTGYEWATIILSSLAEATPVDSTAPVIAVSSPTPEATPGSVGAFSASYATAKDTPIVVDFTDAGGLSFISVSVELSGEVGAEDAYAGDGGATYLTPFLSYSTVTAIANGFRLSIRHDDSWPGGIVATVRARAVDNAGNLTEESFGFILPGEPDEQAAPGADVPADAVNHVAIGLGRLAQQFRQPRIEALTTVLLTPMQDLEDALQQLLLERSVDTAVGVNLDDVGAKVGQARGGLSDDDYRRHIRARIATNRSKGTVADLIRIARAIVYDASMPIVVTRHAVATVSVNLGGPVEPAAAAAFQLFGRAKAGGVRLMTEFSEAAADDTFTLAIAAFASGSISMGATTLTVRTGDAAAFPASGSLVIDEGLAVEEAVTYTHRTASSFLGVSATASAHSANASITWPDAPGLGLGDDVDAGIGGVLAGVLE